MKNKTPTNADDFSAHKLHQQVRQSCLEALHKNAIPTLVANVLVSIVAASVIWIEVSSILVFYWLGTNLLVNGLRFVIASTFPVNGAEPSEYKRWSIYYSIGAAIGGAVWGAAAIVFMTPDLYLLDAFIIICIMGIFTGAASGLAPHFPTFIAFTTPTLLPLIFQLAVRGDLINSALAAMGVLFSIALIIASRNSNLILRASLEEKFKSKKLAHDLKIEHDKNEQSERRFKGVVENVGDAIFIHDRFGKIIEVNQNACEILGYRRDELTLLSILEVEAGHNEVELRNLWDMGTTNPSKFPMTLEGLNRRKSGTVFPVEVRVSILPTDGDILYVASVRDISERKEAEAAADRSAASLINAQRIAHLGSYEWNVVTDELFWSEEHFRIWELDPKLVEPSFKLFMERIHPEDREKAQAAVEYSLNSGDAFDINYRLQMNDGSIKYVESLGEPECDKNGLPLRMVGTIHDITKEHEIQENLIAAKEEAEKANHAKSDFLSSMSHELRTPLNGILGFTQLLQLDPSAPLTDGQKDSTNQVIKSGQHLLDLIDQVLELAQIEAGNLSVSLEPVPMCDLVDECIDMVASMAEKRAITISFENDCPDVNAMGDRTRIRQVILNLLSNAVKYNNEGGSISIAARIDTNDVGNKNIHMAVSDTGPGIAKEKQSGIFEPFNRLGHESSEIEGTGIGLVITRELLRMMDGDMGFESEVGKGSTFWIEIPLAKEQAKEIESENNKQGTVHVLDIPVGSKKQSYKVLYVEDNPANMKLMEKILDRVPNIDMISASTGEIGIEKAMNELPDVILMDINLPGIGGMDAMVELKKLDETKNIPVIAVTAAAMKHEVEEGKKAGFYTYLTKPIKIVELMDYLKEILD